MSLFLYDIGDVVIFQENRYMVVKRHYLEDAHAARVSYALTACAAPADAQWASEHVLTPEPVVPHRSATARQWVSHVPGIPTCP
jgi:hypothetical protein